MLLDTFKIYYHVIGIDLLLIQYELDGFLRTLFFPHQADAIRELLFISHWWRSYEGPYWRLANEERRALYFSKLERIQLDSFYGFKLSVKIIIVSEAKIYYYLVVELDNGQRITYSEQRQAVIA